MPALKIATAIKLSMIDQCNTKNRVAAIAKAFTELIERLDGLGVWELPMMGGRLLECQVMVQVSPEFKQPQNAEQLKEGAPMSAERQSKIAVDLPCALTPQQLAAVIGEGIPVKLDPDLPPGEIRLVPRAGE